jgi:hypothetical protein
MLRRLRMRIDRVVASGFFALMLVRMAVKPVALSFVNSRATVVPPADMTPFANSSTTPWPYPV